MSRKYVHVNKKDVDRAVELYRQGSTIYDLAETYGCHRQTIARHLKQRGIVVGAKLDDEALQMQVQEVYARVGTYAGTAQEIGINRKTVKKIIDMLRDSTC
ncbi:helix-turn-helix domain-containing protein [Pseudoclavibacter sp. CFCC 11306]|uniref:helix-turn-helix domain-containing protein n=1 Tax=Pseudoclavibacter sp. CFCC 11306 TaxID=1564493 RepID=UPI0013011E98|nr:helix-turn-helix domain-containing protein [Pseudoclavibacter sp. CFCC 11306]